jgi:hypothetical protein
VHEVVDRVVFARLRRRIDPALETDLADAVDETLRLDALLDFREAADALLARAR